MTARIVPWRAALVGALAASCVLVLLEPAFAQARNPFSVGISEGGGPTTGLMGWILSQQGYFERALSAAVRASRADGSALWWLAGLSFVYGVLHAAGPGHGKAVLAAYMVANEKALRRGIVLSFLAALLQAMVAIVLVGVLSLAFRVTAIGMRDGAALIEKASYLGVALLGLWLTWRKGAGLLAAWRGIGMPLATPLPRGPELAFAGISSARPTTANYRIGAAAATRTTFACTAADAAPDHAATCAHCHVVDPAALGGAFSWREAISTVAAAGARPCSGAILVLVFALAQGIFVAGITSTIVMALGTAITTAALAATAVLAKSVALRIVGHEDGRGALVARAAELLAALLVAAVGVSLLLGVGPLQGLA